MPATESLSLAFKVQSLLLILKRMISDQSIGLILKQTLQSALQLRIRWKDQGKQ